ncbi:glycoside hydrolase family protein [Hymenobacter actinosclerus]|uniref:Lanthionine synthetase C-like protein n=1 Tax=Hymenobacter actinosclerus TaxID=82805 RepID=A0A1I0DBT0_9BACT|nr:hypothetical protein [Hymenobacter actinosclerus]SET29150.1 hypothetical protein SAMN04487998_1321 [Hymenobacter actinosclerus]
MAYDEVIYAIIRDKKSDIPSMENSSRLAIYYYLLYQRLGQEQDLQHSEALFNAQLTLALAPDSPSAATAGVVGLAWLHSNLANSLVSHKGAAQISLLDQHLLERALKLLPGKEPGVHPELWHIIRYFSQRMAIGQVREQLQMLIAELYGRNASLGATENVDEQGCWTIPMGLPGSLTSEIVLLAEVGIAGIHNELIRQQVHQRVELLLATRREIDFSDGCYSMFPVTVDKITYQPVFSNHLSLLTGADLGASLALYKAQQLLQDAELGHIAELVGLNTILRTQTAATKIEGAQFCQGAFGVVYAYAQLYSLSRHPAYYQSYKYWCTQAERWLGQELSSGHYERQPSDSLCGALGIGLMQQLVAGAEPDISWYAEAIRACLN